VTTQHWLLRARTLLVALCLVVGGALVIASVTRTHSAGAPRAAVADVVASPRRGDASTPKALRAATANDRLPDLDQETPSELALQTRTVDGTRSYVLGFRSAVVNVGAGPLIVKGSRPNQRVPLMRVDQLVEREGAPARVVRHVGRMQYTVSPDHRHWHFLQFDRYLLQRAELRDASGARVLVRDQKTGFCLGDRYRTNQSLRGVAPAQPVFRGRCGLDRPDLLQMLEGISVGYGDDYSAFLEGQDLPLDGLPAGRYVLVHRVNVNHALAESSYRNNAASVLLDLRWSARQPLLRVLATCPNTDRCDHADATFAGARG
jgi:hypothetical protein